MRTRTVRVIALTTLTAAAGLVLGITSGSAAAAAPSLQTLTCDGQQLTLRTTNNNSSEHGGWSAAQIVAGGTGHLVPIEFSGAAVDVTVGQTIFSFEQVKGNSAAAGQQTITCTQTEVGTLADFVDPSQPLPPGTALTDEVSFTLTAIAFHRP